MPPEMNDIQDEVGELLVTSQPLMDTTLPLDTKPVVDIGPKFAASPNARSKSITTAAGPDTHGMLNQHLPENTAFQVGVHDDRGQRRTMEDAYSFVVDFARVRGQGYFAIFDGHAGKYAAEWCGQHFHENLLTQLREHPELPIPDVLNFVTAFLRIEDSNGKQSFLEGLDVGDATSHVSDPAVTPPSVQDQVPYPTPGPSQQSDSPSPSPISDSPSNERKKKGGILNKGSQVVSAIKSLTGTGSSGDEKAEDEKSANSGSVALSGNVREAMTPPPDKSLRRVLYTANAGDARAVLCRGGLAVRLTYDHKGSDKQEAKRITDAGGFVWSGRVNGVLAVTRSLGDSSMKDFVVGAPYTTETELGDDDEFLILACDGLWDVSTDQGAVDMVRNITDPQEASRKLVEHALKESTDNITAIVVRFPSGGAPAS